MFNIHDNNVDKIIDGLDKSEWVSTPPPEPLSEVTGTEMHVPTTFSEEDYFPTDETPCVCETCDCNPVKGERNRLIEQVRSEERERIIEIINDIPEQTGEWSPQIDSFMKEFIRTINEK